MTASLVSTIAIAYAIAFFIVLYYLLPRSKILAGLFTIILGVGLSGSFTSITGANTAIVAAIYTIWGVGIIIFISGFWDMAKDVMNID